MTRCVLVAYATKHGSTREVADLVAASLREHGLDVDLRPAAHVHDLATYAATVLGGALYTGRWHADARRFLAEHREALARQPFAVFGMGPRTLSEADVAQSREQVERALAKTPGVRPLAVAVFGGVVDPAKLHFPFSHMPPGDARDWDAIRAWTSLIADAFNAALDSAPVA